MSTGLTCPCIHGYRDAAPVYPGPTVHKCPASGLCSHPPDNIDNTNNTNKNDDTNNNPNDTDDTDNTNNTHNTNTNDTDNTDNTNNTNNIDNILGEHWGICFNLTNCNC